MTTFFAAFALPGFLWDHAGWCLAGLNLAGVTAAVIRYRSDRGPDSTVAFTACGPTATPPRTTPGRW